MKLYGGHGPSFHTKFNESKIELLSAPLKILNDNVLDLIKPDSITSTTEELSYAGSPAFIIETKYKKDNKDCTLITQYYLDMMRGSYILEVTIKTGDKSWEEIIINKTGKRRGDLSLPAPMILEIKNLINGVEPTLRVTPDMIVRDNAKGGRRKSRITRRVRKGRKGRKHHTRRR